MPDNGLSKLINKIANSSAEDLQKYNNTDFGSNITESDAGQHARIDYSNASDFGKSQYDKTTPIDQLTNNNYQYLRGERQSNWDKAGNGLVNMLGKAVSTAAEGIVNPFYGSIAALTHTDKDGKWDPSMNSYYNNDLTKTLDKINEAVDENNPFYSDKEEATSTGLAKLWHANTIFKDIMGGAGTSIGAFFTGAAWSKGLSLLGKGLAVSADAAEAAALIEEAKTTGIALAGDKLKFVANEAIKKSIKDGARQGTIALMSATGEAGAEAREAQKNIYTKLTTNPDGSPKQMSEGELEYAKMMSEQAGDMAFGMNLPVIMADNWLTFGKAVFGNKTNDFAKIANKTTMFDEATQTWKAVEKSKYANLGYRAGKIGTPMLSEGNQEMLQFAIGKTAEDYYVNKYYNPNAANFLDSFTKGMADAYGTQEGWHSGIIGALSAGLTSPGIVLASQGKDAFKEEFITNPEDKITAQAVESLNKYKTEDIRKKYVDNQIRQANLVEKKDEAIEANDDFNYHNANEDMLFSYAYNRLQNGKLNETKQELNNFKDLTVEELRDNYGIEINVENKAQVEQLTGKGAVQKFVQDRLDKIAKIEDTYNQVTKLFPNAHPDVKELLTYSAQGLESSKKRTNDLNTQVSDILFGKNPQGAQQLSTVIPGMLLTPFTFAKDFAKMNSKQKAMVLDHIQNSDEISPIDKQDISNKLKDIESLKEREEDFVLTYNALKDPKNASVFLAASNNLANKFKNIVSQKEKMDEEETQTSNPSTNPTPVIDNTVTENPHTQWYTSKGLSYTSSEEDIVKAAQEDLANGTLTDQEIEDLLNDWDANKGSQPVPNQPLIPKQHNLTVEGESQSVLRTETKNRDSNYTTFEGKTITLGELRAKFGLASFSEVQALLKEFIKQGIDINNHVKFTVTANNKVTLNLVDGSGNFFPISIIEQFGLGTTASPEDQKKFQEVIDLFYNENGPKTVEEINKLHEQGVIKVNLKRLLNFTLSNVDGNNDFIDPLISFETLESFLEENGTTNYVIKDGASILTDASKGSFTAFEEDNNDIRDGFHMVVDGISQPIKLRLKHNTEASALADKLSEDIQTALAANASLKDIQKLVKKFNEQVFFALKPRESVSTGISLWYDDTHGLHLKKSVLNKKPGSKHKNVAILNKQAVQDINNSTTDQEERTAKIVELTKQGGMLTNINPADLSLAYLIGEINNSELTLNSRPFVETDVKYNTPLNASKKLETSRFESPIGAEGLAKYNVEIAATAPIQMKPFKPKTSQTTNTTTTTTTQDTNTTPQPAPDESITDPFNVPRGAVEDEEAYSVGSEESTGITEQEIEAIKTILPKFITIADIKTIAKNLRVMGIPYGVFKSKVIYLNTAKGKPGTAYHEAFHAVFRTMLTDEQIDKYLDAALKDFNKSGKNMQREITNLLLTVPSYVKKTKAELVDMVLEEYLADKFSEVAQKPISQIKESNNIFKQLWFKIKEFFRNLRNLDDLDVLFSNILKGNFVNSSEIGNRFSNSTDSVFKLLPRYTGGFFSAEQSRKFVNTLAAKMYKIKTGALQDDAYFDINIVNGEQVKALKTDEALLQELLEERLDELNNVGVEYVKSTFKNPENLKIALTKLNDERRLLSDDEKVYSGESAVDILKSAVLDKLNTFNFKTEDEDQEKTEYKDKFSSQEAWLSGGHESLSSTIKAYIGFSTATEIDEITGLEREVAVDEVAVYNGLIRLLADTNKENMIAKLYYATRGSDNPNVKSFYEQVLKDLEITYDPESNTVVLPENQNKINVYNAILTAFDKSNIQMINAYQKEAFNGDVEGLGWMKANTRDTAKITLDRWASNLVNLNRNGLGIKELAKIEKKLNDIAVKYYSKDKIADISNDVKEVQSLFKDFGVNLTTPYIEYSLLKQKESFEEVQQTKKYFTQDQLNILKINEEIVPISWDIFEAAGGFSLVKSLDGNILNLYKGKKLDKELVAIAENNAIFDETTANFSFTNAEGERVYEIISKSDVIAAVIKFNTTDFVKKVLGDFKTDSKGVPLRDSQGRHIFEEDTATSNTTDEVESKNFEFLKQNWILTKYPELFNKGRKAGIKLNMLSGFVDTTLDKGKTKGGITYGKFDQRTYLLSSLGLFYNNGSKSNVARYQFRQNESSGTSYVVELPKINVDKNFKQVGEFFVNQFTNEYNRIKREALEFKTKGPGNLKGYNTNLSDRAFDFTEFQYLKDLLSSKGATESDLLYKEIQNAAIDGKELSSEHLSKVLSAIGITSYDTVNKKGETTTEYAKTGHGMLGINFNEFKKAAERNRISDFLPAEIKDDSGNIDNFLYEFYINDYMMSYSFNELLDGDYALSRKSKDDISKRHKGGIASGNSYGKGEHNSCIIKAVKEKITTRTSNGKLVTVSPKDVVEKYFDKSGKEVDSTTPNAVRKYFTKIGEKEYELAEYKPNDAQSYSSQYHMMMGALRQGRLDETTREIYKELIQFTRRDADGNIVKKINIGDRNIPGFNNFSIQHLFNTMSSFNSKKTVVFDGLRGQYLKMSEIGLVRSSISYVEDHNVDAFVKLTDQLFDYIFQDNFESPEYRATVREISKLYKPIPGMEYLHNLANQADLHEIDHIATEDASKGATLMPVDSRAANFDLSKSKFSIINENKRNQVETPTGKSEVTVGSQILGIITSEQNDSKEINFQGKTIKIGELKKIYYNSINTTRDIAFKNAIRIIKDIKGEILEYGKNNPGTIDIAKLDEYVKRAVLNSGADQSLTEFFDTPFNYNMVQKLVKAEQVVLAHFSKGVLAQKTNGDKVSLVSGVGIHLVREIATGKIISHHQVVKNPSKYSDATKYSTDSKLQYNVKDPVTGELYSECILSQQILTRHGLKIGDTITPEMTDVMKSLGYRIPTGDKQSAISLRVVSLLPDYYNGSGVFPDELVYLSGADFDIDSEFIQMPYFWFKKNKPTVPIKFGSEKTDEDKWEATKFYNLNYNKDFNRIYNDGIKELKLTNPTYVELKGATQYYNDVISHYSNINKELPSDLHDLKKDIDGKIKSLEDLVYQAAANELGLPETQDQFKAAGFPDPSVVASNTGLEAMIGLLTNEYVSHITNGTTSTEEVSSTRDQILEDGFVKSSDSKIKSGNRIVHDIMGKFTDNVKNSEGSQGIGPVANKIQQFAFLMSKITEGNRNIEFKEGSFTFNLAGTKGGTYKAENKDGKRIADQLNMMLNMFTDNAKDPIAGTLNIKLELLGGMTEMIMQGMSFENAVKVINIPVIQEYGELLKTLKYGKKNKMEEKFSKGGTQKEAIQRIIFGEKNLETGKYVKEFTYDDLTLIKANKNAVEVSIEDIDRILKGTPSLGTQLEIFNQFLKITEQGDLMSDINTFLKLNQGLDISFTSLHHDLHKAIDNFQIHGLVGTKDQGLATVTEPHISINELLENDTNTLENIKRALFIDKQVGQKIFIEQTPLFKKELQKMFPSLSKKTVNTQADLEKISKAFLGQISSLGYQQWLNNLLEQPDSEVSQKQKAAISKKLNNLNFGLLFSSLNDESSVTLAKQLEILQAHPTTKNNYFVKYISSRFYELNEKFELEKELSKAKQKNNKAEIERLTQKIEDLKAVESNKFSPKFDYVETRSFVKESDATMSLLIDSVKDLFSVSRTAVLDPTTALTSRQFVDNMFSYLMVKDNMQFKNNSLSKFLPVGMFGQYSSMLDKITESFITNEEFVKNFDLAELAYNFRKIYATDINTPFGSLKFKEIKAEYLDQVLTKDGQLHFKVKKKKGEFKKNLEDMKNVFGFETEKVTIVEDGKTIKVNRPVFPQFMSFKVNGKTNVYELQTAGTSDRLAGKVVSLEGTYKQVEKTGTKGVSLFFAGTYEKALAITDKVENTPKEVEEEIDENILSGEEKAVSLEANEENANSVIVVDKLDDDLENYSDEEDYSEEDDEDASACEGGFSV